MKINWLVGRGSVMRTDIAEKARKSKTLINLSYAKSKKVLNLDNGNLFVLVPTEDF